MSGLASPSKRAIGNSSNAEWRVLPVRFPTRSSSDRSVVGLRSLGRSRDVVEAVSPALLVEMEKRAATTGSAVGELWQLAAGAEPQIQSQAQTGQV